MGTSASCEFPKYLLITNGEPRFYSMSAAGRAWDNGWADVKMGEVVLLDADGRCRKMTPSDCRAIENAADEYSGSK